MELPMRFRNVATMSMYSVAVGAPVEGAGVGVAVGAGAAFGDDVSLVRINSER